MPLIQVERRPPGVLDAACLGIGVCMLVAGILPYAWGDPPASLFFDDFFYYLVTADGLLATGRPEFFPGVPTNGFHPLWMACLTLLRAMLPGDFGFLLALSVISLVLMLWTVRLLARILLRLTRDAPSAAIGVVLSSAGVLVLGVSGLEVVLTLPLLLLLFEKLLEGRGAVTGARQGIAVGLLASLTVLSRLDSGLLVAPLLLAVALQGRPRPAEVLRSAGWISLGLLPVGAYLVANRLVFDVWLPISGVAKQLKSPAAFTPLPWLELWRRTPGLQTLMVLWALAWLGGLAVTVRGSASSCGSRPLVWTLLGAPVAFVFVHGLLTDWPLWPWYLYPWLPVAGVGAALLARASQPFLTPVVLHGICVGLGLNLLAFTVQTLYRSTENWIYEIAEAVRSEAQGGPATRYSMGDAAGTVAYLLERPVLQTEGLVMDRGFVDRITAEQDLVSVLQAYAIDVHVTIHAARSGDCWVVSEPTLAGPASPRMRGRFCGPPRFVVDTPTLRVWGFDVPPRGP